MSSPLFSRLTASASLAALLLVSACTTPSTTPPESAAATSALPTLAYDGSKDALAALDREIAAAGNTTATLTALARRLTAMLRDPSTTFAARQAIAQRLGLFPAPALAANANADLFTAMLVDAQQVDLARLALEPVAGSAIDALFIDALAKAGDAPTRLALIQSLGNRHVAAAVAPLAPALRDSDPKIAAAAAKALGQIGTADALATLRATASQSAAVVEATLAAAARVRGADAARTYQTIGDNTALPAHLRAAAARSLLDLEPAAAPKRIVAVLAGSDATLKAAAIEAIASHPSPELVPTLTANLAAWDAPTQSAVIAALARKGDARAVRAIADATTHTDATVRRDAIAALGFLAGNADIVRLLAGIAAGSNPEEAKLARTSLARLNGPGVADAVLAGARAGDPALRVVFIEQIASRYMIDAIPALFALRNDSDPAIRSAALGSLAEIAPAGEQAAVLDWTIAAAHAGEQARALRALAEVTLRNPDSAQRALPITAALAQADDTLALRLLPVLPRIGGATSAEAAAALANRDNPALANAAVTTLSRWPDRTGLIPLVGVAENVRADSTRAAAVQSAIRFLERYRELPPAELVTAVARLLEVSRDDAARQRLVFLLGRGNDDTALALTKKLAAEPALAAEAADAALAIAANQAGPATAQASSNNGIVRNIFDGRTDNRWVTSIEPGRSIEIDFKLSRPVRQVILDQTSHPDNFPEHVEIFVTDDPQNPGEARASADGTPNRTVIDLPANTRGRHLIIRNTKDRLDGWWSISELYYD